MILRNCIQFIQKETQGKSEEYIGDWVKNKNIRDKVVIATKITSNHPKIIEQQNYLGLEKVAQNLNSIKKI